MTLPPPFYEEPGITLYCSDSTELLPKLQESFDMVFTSAPYNMGSAPWAHLGNWKQGDSAGGKSKWRNGSDGSGGVRYDEHDDAMPWERYVEQQHLVLSQCWGALSGNGAIFYNHKPRVIGGRLWTPLELNPGLPLRQIITWARAGGMNFNPTAFVPTYEWILVMAKEGWRLKSKAASGMGDLWRVNQEQQNPHPAPFPLELPARAIEAAAPASILDPFCGSGTTLVAAKAAGVRGVGIEKSERYCEQAVERLRQGVLPFAELPFG